MSYIRPEIESFIYCSKRAKIKRLSEIENELEDQSANYGKRLKDSELYDFKIIGKNGKKFHIHKLILSANSDVFKKLIECNENLIQLTIPDFSENSVQKMIQFCYTKIIDNWLDTTSEFQEMVKISDKYKMEGMKLLCEKRILETINLENCAEFFVLAHKDPSFSSFELEESILEFINGNKEELKNIEAFKIKARENHDLFFNALFF